MAAVAGGQKLEFRSTTLTCGYLKDGRCIVYAARPLVCRLWGVVPEMPCQWGCTPARMLTSAEGRVLMQKALQLGGGIEVAEERFP